MEAEAADMGPGQQYEKEAASLVPLPQEATVVAGSPEEVDCDTPPPLPSALGGTLSAGILE